MIPWFGLRGGAMCPGNNVWWNVFLYFWEVYSQYTLSSPFRPPPKKDSKELNQPTIAMCSFFLLLYIFLSNKTGKLLEISSGEAPFFFVSLFFQVVFFQLRWVTRPTRWALRKWGTKRSGEQWKKPWLPSNIAGWEIHDLKMFLLLKTVVFHCYVRFFGV